MSRPSKNDRVSLHPFALILTVILSMGAILLILHLNQKPSAPEIRPVGAPVSPEVTPLPEATALPPPPPSKIPPPRSSDLILSDSQRGVPGQEPSEWLYFRAPSAEKVQISGAWNGWTEKSPLRQVKPGLWAFHIGGVQVPIGSYEFKFIVDGAWEGGANRVLHFNELGLMAAPPRVVAQTLIEHPHQIRLFFYETPKDPDNISVTLKPEHGRLELRWKIPEVDSRLQGFELQGEKVEFVFDPARYRMDSQSVQRVQVAGTFNAWNAEDGNLRLEPQEDGTWRVSAFYQNLTHANTAEHLMFKFVVNGEWKNPPEDAPNAMLEPGTPHQNLSLPLDGGARPELIVQTAEPIDLSAPPLLTLTGAWESALHLTPSPGAILDTLFADKAMGVTLDRENQQTHYRLFAPRATEVVLGFFDGPYYVTEDGEAVPPVQTFPLKKSDDGVWEHTQPGLNIGQYYAYQVHGMVGNGEGFQPGIWLGDPYATAVALAEGNSIVMDLEASPVRPQPKPRIAWEDMIVYETHVRHLTQDPSSGVPEALRGKYKGILASEGTGTGLDHLKALGVNVIQLMPIHEFNNGFGDRHDWGYATCFFFAPESSYATRPLEGSQVKEFRELVDGLHSRGFAVFLDVVYNHIGGVNVFNQIDRKYYFRLNPDFTNQNFSGCGNDVASERPMMRKLIKESVLFWVEEYGIDGFRFDLAELIDDRTLLEIEHEIRQKHPHVVLHSEPWSFRGSHKDFLGPTTWGAWNDRFREPAKAFVVGNGNPEQVKQAIRGSVENWTRHPLQSVNYMESHDDNSLVDELTLNPGMDGRILSERDEKIHKLAATLIFGSLGTPMITEGQAFLRSKHGVRNTYNRGDKLNSLRWEERERPHAKEVLNYYRQMIAFRQSEAGRALRVKDAPSLEYTRFLETGNSNALGWILNATRERPGVPMVMILMNTDVVPVNFEVDLPRGTWRQIGDGQQVDGFGIPGFQFIPGGKKFEVTVPPQTALLYRSGMP